MRENNSITIEIVLSNDIEIGSQLGVYRTGNRDGSNKSLYRGWFPAWPSDDLRSGLGFGKLGQDSFLGQGSDALDEQLSTTEQTGLGYGYLGYGELGYWTPIREIPISNLPDGLHIFDVRIKDPAGNISSPIIEDLTIYICSRPDAVTSIEAESFENQTMRLRIEA